MNDLKRPFIWEDVTHVWYHRDRKLHTSDSCQYCSDGHRKVEIETMNITAKELCSECVENYEFNPTKHRDGYTQAELLEWIDRFVRVFGVIPRSRDMETPIGPRPQVYRKEFGTFSNALEAAGYE